MNAIPGWIKKDWRLGMSSESEAGETMLREEAEAAMAAWRAEENTLDALPEIHRSYCRG